VVQRLHDDLPGQSVSIKTKRKFIHIRSKNQQKYVLDIKQKDCTFGIGPAGTGKTYLAVARAVEALEASDVRRIILVRPAVEAAICLFSPLMVKSSPLLFIMTSRLLLIRSKCLSNEPQTLES
jgi:phosphate starvation-inducible protein PhoH